MLMKGRKYLLLALIPLILALALAGCGKKNPDPTPQDTILGPGGERIDYTIVTDAYTGESGLLNVRAPDSDFMSVDNQLPDLLSPVFFDYDLVSILPGQREILQGAAAHLLDNPNDKLLIEGHCDWRGTTEYNLALGDRRANNVKQYLAALGVAEDRMETNSKGDFDAIEEGSSDQMANDRRCDLIVVR